MPRLPPGPIYLARRVPYLVVPPAAVYLASKIVYNELGISIPGWAVASLSVIAFPAAFLLVRTYGRFIEQRRAAALGAEVIPSVKEEWPSVVGLSVMGAVVESYKNGFPGEIFLDWIERYGNVFQLRLATDNRIVTFEPEHVKAVLASQFDNFIKGEMFYDQMGSLLGTGVFNSDGEMWKFHRSMTRPFFTRERISDFDTFDTHAEEALKQARIRLDEGYAIDFQDLVARFTLDSATEFLFGYDVKSLSAGLAYPPKSGIPDSPAFLNHPSNIFVDAFIRGQINSGHRTRLSAHWPLTEFWKDKVAVDRAVVDSYVQPLMTKALGELREKRASGHAEKEEGEDVTLLQHLVRHTQDETILKDELLNLLVAGRDTTATTLTFALYMLAEHPDIADRLRAEIVSKLGYTRRPNYDDMRELKYLRAFINEVLRLYPPVPFDGRVSVKGTVFHSMTKDGPKSHYVPPNTRVLYGVLYMHRRKDLWGPDAEEFDPDRFIDERLHKYLIPNPYIFCPFNAGPRICLGQQYAYHESSFFLIRLLQQFTNFRLATDVMPDDAKPRERWAARHDRLSTEKIWVSSHLTSYAKGGLWVRMDELKPESE